MLQCSFNGLVNVKILLKVVPTTFTGSLAPGGREDERNCSTSYIFFRASRENLRPFDKKVSLIKSVNTCKHPQHALPTTVTDNMSLIFGQD